MSVYSRIGTRRVPPSVSRSRSSLRTIISSEITKGWGSQLIAAAVAPANENGDHRAAIVRRERLGGVLNYYHRRAA